MDKKGSISSSSAAGGGDAIHGLNFGRKIYFEGVGSVFRPRTDNGPPAKKGRGTAAQGGQPPRCQVEGCNVDLSDVKAYYSRHKVCGMHSKSPTVIVAGIEQRFCQQCSRFHRLSEFDQGKRSCRRRLAGHNERRRKPPPIPMLSPHFGHFATSTIGYDNQQNKPGGFLMNFSSCSNVHGRESQLGNQYNHHQGYSSMMKYEIPWQISNNSSSLNPTTKVSLSSSSSEECYGTRVVSKSSGALSLLSNHQPRARGSRTLAPPSIIGLNNVLGNNCMNTAGHQPLSVDGQFGNALWDYKGNDEMCPDLGLAHMSHNGIRNNESSSSNSQYNGGIGLPQQQASEGQFYELGLSSSYDPCSSSSVQQHMNWMF